MTLYRLYWYFGLLIFEILMIVLQNLYDALGKLRKCTYLTHFCYVFWLFIAHIYNPLSEILFESRENVAQYLIPYIARLGNSVKPRTGLYQPHRRRPYPKPHLP